MGLIIGVLAVVVVFAFMLAPVVRRRRLEEVEAERWDLGRADLESQREVIYRDLRDLDFDHGAGKLSDADYQQLRRQLQQRAAAVLMHLDETDVDYEQDLDRRVRSRRRMRVCPSCQVDLTSPSRFCPNCGATLEAAVSK